MRHTHSGVGLRLGVCYGICYGLSNWFPSLWATGEAYIVVSRPLPRARQSAAKPSWVRNVGNPLGLQFEIEITTKRCSIIKREINTEFDCD